MVIAEFGCGIAGYVYRNEVGDWIGDNMKNTLVNYKKDDFESVTGAWDLVQPTSDDHPTFCDRTLQE